MKKTNYVDDGLPFMFFACFVLMGVLWFAVMAGSPPKTEHFEPIKRPKVREVDKEFHAYTYKYTGGHYQDEAIPFRLHIPSYAKSTKTKYPLFVFFHGRGNFGGNYKQLACLKDVKYDGTFFLLAASCNKQHDCWGTVETDSELRSECPAHVTLEIIQNLILDFPIDEGQIHLIGYSDGTNAVSYMINEGLQPKSAIYIGNEPPKENDVYFDEQGRYKIMETDIYFFYGVSDPTFAAGTIKPFADKVNHGGGQCSVYPLYAPYEGHDSYKYVLGEFQLIQKLVKGQLKWGKDITH